MMLRVVLALGLCALPLICHAQTPAQLQAAADAARANDAIGQVTAVEGSASVTRNNAAAAPLRKDAEIFRDDVVQTGSGTLSITFDDETTFNLSPNTRVTIDEFVYEAKAKGNSAAFNVARGTVAFVASQVAKTGDMTIATPTATMGIRGTTGLVEVPEGAGSAGASDARIKLYPDSDGRVGRIEVFEPGQGGQRFGQRLGLLTAGASAFAIRGAGGRFSAVPFAIPAQEAARDRGVVQRLFQSHNFGRQIATQRRQMRLQRDPQRLQQRQGPGQRGLQQQNPGQRGLQQPRNLQQQQQAPNDPRRRIPPNAADQDQPQQQQQQQQIQQRQIQQQQRRFQTPERGRIERFTPPRLQGR
jgi:hypothetical protein